MRRVRRNSKNGEGEKKRNTCRYSHTGVLAISYNLLLLMTLKAGAVNNVHLLFFEEVDYEERSDIFVGEKLHK